ncbi:MAG: acyl-CoA--6-aminopenicillanic acid acyltransferase [Candidatus Lambdaproteobacteria bacterium]|nr:acyl-CoA--6-aminopenicillanic acid acyltransferase [Candidatus Lambdaproteobacteria bacterium]
MATPTFPVIRIEGPPRERGRQYGRLAAERIAASLALYQGAWAGSGGLDRAQVLERARAFIPGIEARFPQQMEELRGMAEGAERLVEELVALNARTELLYGSAGGAGAATEGCTAAAILPRKPGDPVLIGQNWDWKPDSRELAILLQVHPDCGPACMTFVEAGMMARNGMNAAGIGLCGNFLNAAGDFSRAGVPIPFVRRAILASASLPEAVGQVLNAPRAFSSNHLLAHRDGEAIDLEATPAQVFSVFPQDGLLVHANHFQAGAGHVVDTGVARFPDSLFRDRRVRAALAATRGRLNATHLQRALRDHFGHPYGVCRHRAVGADGNELETVASVVMDLSAGTMAVAHGPVCENGYTVYAPFAPVAAGAAVSG